MLNAPGINSEPDCLLDEGIEEDEGVEVGAGVVASVLTFKAASQGALLAAIYFTRLNPSFLRMGQLHVL